MHRTSVGRGSKTNSFAFTVLVIDFFTLLIFIGFNCLRRWCCCCNIPELFHSRSFLISSHLVLHRNGFFLTERCNGDAENMHFNSIDSSKCVFVFHSFRFFSNSISSILFFWCNWDMQVTEWFNEIGFFWESPLLNYKKAATAHSSTRERSA